MPQGYNIISARGHVVHSIKSLALSGLEDEISAYRHFPRTLKTVGPNHRLHSHANTS